MTVKEYGYEYDAALQSTIWEKTKGQITKDRLFNAHCLRSGRDALKAVAREFEPCIALLPALACDSMVLPFRLFGHEIRYYRLNSDYSINIESIEREIGNKRILFLYMEYFGKSAICDEGLEYLQQMGNIVFIEDRTHNLIWDRKNAFKTDYTIASLRKWLPIPDGGLLWGRLAKPLGNDIVFSSTRLKAQIMRHNYLACGDERIKTEYREIFSTVSNIMDQDDPSAMSAYSFLLTKNTDLDTVRCIRKHNAEMLISVLSTSPYITLIQDKAGKSDLYVAFNVPNRNEIQKRLSAMKIFNTIIWPLSDEQKRTCEVAKYTEESMLAAPCDQRYSEDDMKYIGEKIVRVTADVNR